MSDVASFLRATLQTIPSSFWGVLAGAAFSLSGVVLSNRASERRLRVQLIEERALRNRERELSLRRDIYLAATEAISSGLAVIGRLADCEPALNSITSDYLSKAPAIAKIYLVAKEETARAVGELTVAINGAHLRLSLKRAPLVAQKQHVAFLTKQISNFQAERTRILELMRQFNLEGDTDKRKWQVMEDNYKFENERIESTSKESSALALDLYLKQVEFARQCMEESRRVSELEIPALVASRDELELPIDSTAFAEIIRQGVAQQEDVLNEFLAEAHRLATGAGVAAENPSNR